MPKPEYPEPTGEDFIGKYERDRDSKAAAERAIAGASRPRSQANDATRYRYAQQALLREPELLASTSKGNRNHQLNVSAMKLAQFVAGGWLEQSEVDAALEDACRANGHIQEDGWKMYAGTLKSGTEKGLSEPRDLSEVGLLGVREYTAIPAPIMLNMGHIVELEGEFWRSRRSLEIIYQAALAGMAAPWAVLGCCAAKALTLVPVTVRLPAIIGSPGSFNWFVALAAPSGGGKGAALSVADRLIRSTVRQRNIGSGEGMIEAYRRPRDKETGQPGGQYEAIMFVADEIDTMTAHQSRSGSTLLPTLRSAFSGTTIGASTKASSGFQLEKHSYRWTLIVGAQPARASAILDDVHGGTAQRFMWFPATDARIPLEEVAFPEELDLPSTITGAERYSNLWSFDGCILEPSLGHMPEKAVRAIRSARVKFVRGQADSKDSHRLYCQEKFAYALAVLDGRDTMTEQDWDLAGIATKVSDYTREWVAEGQEDAIREDAEKYGRTTGYAQASAEVTKMAASNDAVNRVMKGIAAKIKDAGPEGISQRDLSRAVAYRDRGYLMAAQNLLQEENIALKDDTTWKLVKWMNEQSF